MKLILFAYNDIGYVALKTLHEMGHEICAVFTHPDDPKENVWFRSVRQLAEILKIPVFDPDNINDTEWIKKIKNYQPDALFSFYYRKMICDNILTIPPKGAFNLHGSLLPKYRGRVPIHWAIIHGEKETGLTLHFMVKKPDAGDILAQKKVTIEEDDTALSVYQKLVPLTQKILLKTIPQIEKGTFDRTPQNPTFATYFSGRKPEDGKINWNQTNKQIYNLIRAVTHPYPGAFTEWEGKKMIIWKAKKIPLKTNEKPETRLSKNPFIIACGQGAIEILEHEIVNLNIK